MTLLFHDHIGCLYLLRAGSTARIILHLLQNSQNMQQIQKNASICGKNHTKDQSGNQLGHKHRCTKQNRQQIHRQLSCKKLCQNRGNKTACIF